jgi:hypothetical protein
MSSTLLVSAPGHSIKPFGLILLGYALWYRGQILRVHSTVAIDQGIYLVALIFSLSGTKRFQLHQYRLIEELCGTTYPPRFRWLVAQDKREITSFGFQHGLGWLLIGKSEVRRVSIGTMGERLIVNIR